MCANLDRNFDLSLVRQIKNWGGFPLDRGWLGSHYSSTSAPLLLGAHLSCLLAAASGWAATRVRKQDCIATVKL